MNLWERTLFFSILRRTVLLLLIFFLIYVLIDYANHTGHFHHSKTRPTLAEFFIFYMGKFFLELDLLLPFAFLVAALTVAALLNTRKELIALFAAKISTRTIARPFFVSAFLCTFLILLNFEYLSPYLAKKNQLLLERHELMQNLTKERGALNKVVLEDQSIFLFKKYSLQDNRFENAVWIKDPDHFFTMSALVINSKEQTADGQNVFTFEKKGSLGFSLASKNESVTFSPFPLNLKDLRGSMGREEEFSLTTLIHRSEQENPESEKSARTKTEFIFRLLFALLPPVTLLLNLPDCFVISRHFSILKVTAKGIFTLALVILVLNALATLSQRQTLSPISALIIPFSLFSLLCMIRFQRNVQ